MRDKCISSKPSRDTETAADDEFTPCTEELTYSWWGVGVDGYHFLFGSDPRSPDEPSLHPGVASALFSLPTSDFILTPALVLPIIPVFPVIGLYNTSASTLPIYFPAS